MYSLVYSYLTIKWHVFYEPYIKWLKTRKKNTNLINT